jgi:hypothetical protein
MAFFFQAMFETLKGIDRALKGRSSAATIWMERQSLVQKRLVDLRFRIVRCILVL